MLAIAHILRYQYSFPNPHATKLYISSIQNLKREFFTPRLYSHLHDRIEIPLTAACFISAIHFMLYILWQDIYLYIKVNQ